MEQDGGCGQLLTAGGATIFQGGLRYSGEKIFTSKLLSQGDELQLFIWSVSDC